MRHCFIALQDCVLLDGGAGCLHCYGVGVCMVQNGVGATAVRTVIKKPCHRGRVLQIIGNAISWPDG